MDKKNWFGNNFDSVKEKIKDARGTVRDAPEVFKKRIYLICGLSVFLFVLALLSALVSLIPAADSLKGLAVIALVAGIYFAMSLPQYVCAAKNYVVVVGTVVAVKQKEGIRNAAKGFAMDVVMNRGRYRTVTVAVNDSAGEGGDDGDDDEEKLRLQVPDTFLMPVTAGRRYQFYYMVQPPDISLSKNPYGIENFLFVREENAKETAIWSAQGKEDHFE